MLRATFRSLIPRACLPLPSCPTRATLFFCRACSISVMSAPVEPPTSSAPQSNAPDGRSNPEGPKVSSSKIAKKEKKAGTSADPSKPLLEVGLLTLLLLHPLPSQTIVQQQMQPPPEYLAHRIKMWDQLKAEQDEFYRSKHCLNPNLIPYSRSAHCATRLHATFKDQSRQEIQVTLSNGSKREGTSWETTPMDIARRISSSLAQRIVIAKGRLSPIQHLYCF